ncbi:HEPN domain-containing protein [Burkholderia lata]|uniref:Uncharacterized protein n=1 Tax=Burkholderia lata (strain ATCC 17760 / DSM 23089 / LMG 22485 / NCIMB 9086 / R18194 / 383) TaxID=482957 RepID=A0A6P2V7I3_BURL3|nr:HEPN domain-containing protein [Burkholderia lata]VWC79356.1 hypothetical protein BLA18109_03128 [Burkholderia lata]
MQLHRGQLAALESFIGALEIRRGRLPKIGGNDHLVTFKRQILEAPHWRALIGQSEFYEILYGTIFSHLSQLPEDYAGALADADGGATLAILKDRLIDAFESLPRSYDLFIPLKSLQAIHQTEIPISNEISIVDSENHSILAPLLTPSSPIELRGLLSGIFQSPSNAVSRRYLRIRASGFGSDMPNSPAVRDAWSTAKQLAFVGIASGKLSMKHDWLFRDSSSTVVDPAILVELWNTQSTKWLNPDLEVLRFFNSLAITEPITVLDLSGTTAQSLLNAPEREATTPDEFARAIRMRMDPAIAFIHLDTADAAPVRAAMEWFIDADSNQNETVAFLQRCIGLEAVLGSTESKRDVTERLADRYAYLVCTTASARDVERKRFVDMYKHRSEIVHGRAMKLSENHMRASRDARQMLLQVTWREMQNLLSDARKARIES